MAGNLDDITRAIVDSSFKLHTRLGPGLLESVYQTVLASDLRRRGLKVETQQNIAFEFEGMRFDRGLVVDLLVEGQVVVEIKSVERLAPVHFKQTLTYLRLLNLQVGLLINFGGATLKEGLRRIVNGYDDSHLQPLEQLADETQSASPSELSEVFSASSAPSA